MAHRKSLLERIPENILFYEILSKLKEEEEKEERLMTLCTLKCVSKTLNSSVNKHIFSLSSFDLSGLSMDSNTLNGISKRFGKVKNITLDCLRLDDLSIKPVLGRDIEELILLKCYSLSYDLLICIGYHCPNLRVLSIEVSDIHEKSTVFDDMLSSLLIYCPCLESLEITVRTKETSGNRLMFPGVPLPQTIKVLKLDLRVLFGTPNIGPTLTHLLLILDLMTDVIIQTIVHSCPLLVELELIDVPTSMPRWSHELSDEGVQSLVGCKHLPSLSLIRSQQHISTGFARTTDIGMISLSEGCLGLESVRLHGFSRVNNAGFISILTSCLNLKKFDIQNAYRLRDSAFKDDSKVPRPFVEVKLVSCSYITSEGVCEMATLSCNSLEILDLRGCQRVADSCLSNVSCLTLLTSLNLGGTNVTDAGMAVLGKGNAPISCLYLRRCHRITDEGISSLLGGEGKMGKTLSSLDLGHVYKITDNAISVIADACARLIELCVRNCFMVTDEAMKTLAIRGRLQNECKFLQRLDIFNCPGVSVESYEFFKKPLFRGLQWIGIGETRLILVGDARLAEIYMERPWLTVCKDGCEIGCRDEWSNHKFKL